MTQVRSNAEITLKGSTAAFARVAYSDLVTILTLSVLTALSAVPVVTFGPALIALVDTITAVVLGEGRGGPTTERARVRLYLTSLREHFRAGVPFSIILAGTVGATLAYVDIATATLSAGFLVGALLGLYAIVIGLVWTLRAASVIVRSDGDRPGTLAALIEGGRIGLLDPTYTALHVIVAATLMMAASWLVIAVPLVLFGLLAVLEVVAFEELTGDGAIRIIHAYRGELQ